MHAKSKLVSIVMSLVLALGFCPVPAFASDLAAASAGLTVQTAGTDDYPANLKKAAKDSVVDPWGFYNRECTSFAAWRLNNDNGVAFNNYYGGAHWGNASNWGSAARSLGITVDSNPAVGSVAWWGSGTFGHVAWVQSVSGNNVTIEEYNYNNNGAYNRRTIAKSSASGYIHIKDLGNAAPNLVRVFPEDGAYTIQSKVGNKVLDVAGGSKENGANVQIYQPLGNGAQVFDVVRNTTNDANWIQLRGSNKWIDTEGNPNGTGNAKTWQDTGANGQYWRFYDAGDGYVYIRNLWGYFLDVDDSKDENGRNVVVWSYTGGDNQKWKLVKSSGNTRINVEPGDYVIQSAVGTKKVLDVFDASSANEANYQIYTPNGTAAQIFSVSWNSSKEANRIAMKASGKSMDTQWDTNGISNVQQFDSNNGNGQAWFFESAGDGYAYIRNMWGYYLDVYDGKDTNSQNVQVWDFNGSKAQKWKLVNVSGKTRANVKAGEYMLQSGLGDRVLEVAGASKANAANVQIGTQDEDAGQVFSIEWESAQGANVIKLKSSGKVLDSEGDMNGVTNVIQYAANYSNGQLWFFEGAGDGWYYIRNLWGYYLDVNAGRDAEGQNVQVWSFNGAKGQKWKLVSQPSPDPSNATDTPNPSVPTDPKDPTGSTDPAKPTTPTEPTEPTKPTIPTEPMQPATPTTPADPADPTDQDPAADAGKDDKSQTGDVTAKPTSIAKAAVTGVKSKTYTGKALAQRPTVKVDGKALKAGVDYTLTYANNVKVGKATMTITGKGSYAGAKRAKFTIAKANVKNVKAAKVKAQKYRKGKAIKPNPKITYKGKKLKKGTDYTLKYKNNKKRGTATITVKGKGNFKGSKAIKFKIR